MSDGWKRKELKINQRILVKAAFWDGMFPHAQFTRNSFPGPIFAQTEKNLCRLNLFYFVNLEPPAGDWMMASDAAHLEQVAADEGEVLDETKVLKALLTSLQSLHEMFATVHQDLETMNENYKQLHTVCQRWQDIFKAQQDS